MTGGGYGCSIPDALSWGSRCVWVSAALGTQKTLNKCLLSRLGFFPSISKIEKGGEGTYRGRPRAAGSSCTVGQRPFLHCVNLKASAGTRAPLGLSSSSGTLLQESSAVSKRQLFPWRRVQGQRPLRQWTSSFSFATFVGSVSNYAAKQTSVK